MSEKINSNRKVGRPCKYVNNLERINAKVIQDREAKRRQRLRAKLKNKEIPELLYGKKRSLLYSKRIADYFERFEYNYYITLTIDCRVEKDLVDKDLVEFDTAMNVIYPSPFGVKRAIDRYLRRLSRKYRIDRWFYVIERGNGRLHAHLVLRTSKINFNQLFIDYSEDAWTIGKALCKHVENEKMVFVGFSYLTKEFEPNRRVETDLWDFYGKYSPNYARPSSLVTLECV